MKSSRPSPRGAFFSSSPLHDDNFAVDGVTKADAAARPVFELLGARDKLKVIYPDCAARLPAGGAAARRSRSSTRRLANTPPGPSRSRRITAAELPRIPPHEPKDALSTFQTLPGFHIEQVAAEPLVASPVAMSFDENGRLFVVEMRDYSEQDKERLGRIRMLEDTDGDGVSTRAPSSPTSSPGRRRSSATTAACSSARRPDIYYLKDTDGDGKADVRKVVFTGFGRSNVQGLINSFQWGLDNRIHGATSTSGGKVRRARRPERARRSTSAAATSPSTRARSTCAPRAAARSTG